MPIRSLAVLAAFATLFASPARADVSDAGDARIRAIVAAFEAGEAIDFAELEAALEPGRDGRGVLTLGIFDGALLPLDAPLVLSAPDQRALTCETVAESDLQPTVVSQETMLLNRRADDRLEITFTTVDPSSRLVMRLLSDGMETELTSLKFADDAGEEYYETAGNGAFREVLSGTDLPVGSPDAVALTSIADGTVLANPTWFYDRVAVEVGQRWLTSGGAEDIARTLDVLAQAIMPGTRVVMEHIVTTVSGGATLDGAPHFVFEVILQARFETPGLDGPATIRLVAFEAFGVEMLTRNLYESRIQFVLPGNTVNFGQAQRCRPS